MIQYYSKCKIMQTNCHGISDGNQGEEEGQHKHLPVLGAAQVEVHVESVIFANGTFSKRHTGSRSSNPVRSIRRSERGEQKSVELSKHSIEWHGITSPLNIQLLNPKDW